MKKLIIIFAIMISAVSAFAAEGDADKLAGEVIGLVCTICAMIGLIGVLYALCEFIDWCSKVWNKLTKVGKIVMFGIPLTAVAVGLFYGLFYYVIPWMVSTVIPSLVHSTERTFICVIIFEFICMCLGWTVFLKYDGCVGSEKRYGRLATVARFIVLLPLLPVLYVGYYLVQLFKWICIKDAAIDLNPYIIRKRVSTR